MKTLVVAADMVTAYGRGIDATWHGLLSGQSALAHSERLHYPSGSDKTPLGLVPGISPGDTVAIQMLQPMLRDLRSNIPEDTLILLATTTGEIEYLEAAALQQPGSESAAESDPSRLLEKVCILCGTTRGGIVISAACASATVAIAQAASLIQSGAESSVLVVACDAVSEFVYAGFATMRALDPAGARPFDRDRQGLNLGEAAAIALFMDSTRAQHEHRASLGAVSGWAVTNDAAHVTRPDTTGEPLARASKHALERAGVEPDDVAFISAHGTGTRYNDTMEMAAFQSIFTPRPLFSVKGGLGHTLGAAGLLEVLLSLRALTEGVLPPTLGLQHPEECAAGWLQRDEPQTLSRLGGSALTTNSGFGGINAALVVTVGEKNHNTRIPTPPPSPLLTPGGIGWITSTAYGRVRLGEACTYAERTTSRLVGSVDALFRHKIASFGRFDPVSRMTCYAGALALRDAEIEYSPEAKQGIGMVGVGFTGSLAANREYFKDYVDSGRILARGNLFVYTLPSAALGEAAIHFGFHGPLFSIIEPSTPFIKGLEMARWLVKNGDAPAILVVQAEADCALAAVVGPDSHECLKRLEKLALVQPKLTQLISQLTTQQKDISSCA